MRLMDKRSGMEFVNVLPETACRVVARYERNGQLTGDTTFQPEDASVQPLENGFPTQLPEEKEEEQHEVAQ